jgi:hypothetical protein
MNSCLYCGKPVKSKYCGATCQNKHQGSIRSDKKYGIFKNFTVFCYKCGKDFEVNEREIFFPEKEKYYCSRSCSNSRTWSDDDKKKKSESLKGKVFKKIRKKETHPRKKTSFRYVEYVGTQCKNCNEIFTHLKRKKRTFCSTSCATTYINKTTDRCNRGGLKSANIQKETRRSKNEIYFSKLCECEFKNILFNDPIFNGWDADVILNDLKIAILWNGKWHYEKITQKHSVKQVQNRDRIKIKEIINCGYTPYIIKDMGKFNKEFADNEFQKLKIYCGLEKSVISEVS